MNDHHCGFTSGPCPNAKKCVYPRCDIEYSGSPMWAALKQVVTHDMTEKKPIPKPMADTMRIVPKDPPVDDSFD